MPGSCELPRAADWAETYPLSQATDVNSSGLGYSDPAEERDFFSELSIPSVHGGNGGNSHFSENTTSTAQVHPALGGWKDPLNINPWNDASMSQNFLQLCGFGETSRFEGGTASPNYNFSDNNKFVHVQKKPTSQASLGHRVTKRRRRPEGRTIYSAANIDDFSGSLHTSDLKMTNASQDGQRRGALIRKRKRTDGGPEAVLEGIFIVTREPNNGQTKSIADFIGWEFQDVNEWFAKRARWEVSHTSLTRSQNFDVQSTSSTNNPLPLDLGDSGFFELPGNLVGITRSKKRLKHHPHSGTKIKDVNDHDDEEEAKTYPCIHEKCTNSFVKLGDWKRHMASKHYPDRWACLLKEEGQILPTDGACSSCKVSFESVRDLKEHIHLSTGCPDTSAIVEVFDRKDKLMLHMEKCHGFDTTSRHLEDEELCEREIRDFDQKCGFCELSFTNWDKKIKHVGTHFKDEGQKISNWRYPHYNGGRSALDKPLGDGHALPGDRLFDSDGDTSDSDDSDDDDDVGDRPKQRAYNRRDDRDQDKGGNSSSGSTSHPPPDGTYRGSDDSSSKNSKDNTKYGKGSHVRYGGRSAQEGETEAGDDASATANPYWHPKLHYLCSLGAMPPHQNIRRLGRGGFGAVNEIRIEGTNQVIARKRIRRFPGQERDFAIELEMIRKLRDLDHPHVVRFLGSYITDTHIDILMLPVADYDLNDFMLQQQYPVPAAVKSQMAGFYSCLVSAIKYIHERDIRHRDIKPKNILIANGAVLIADFGSASDTYHEAGDESVGITPKYMAPEVFSGGRHGCAADIWSLGCVFMELATIIHDKTLFEFELFRSSNARFKVAQPFHKTTRELHEWLKALPIIGPAPSLVWQGVSYLDTIAEMLQEDEGKRPSATELLRRFLPSSCCSMNIDGTRSPLFSNQPGLTELTEKDRITEVIPKTWKDNSHGSKWIKSNSEISMWLKSDSGIERAPKKAQSLRIGAKDLAEDWSYSPPNSEEPAGIKRRGRRRHVEEGRKDVAATRKRGACHECRQLKIKV